MCEIESTNYWGEDVVISEDQYEMCIHQSRTLVKLPLNDGFVLLVERDGENMRAFSYEPRPWIVCFMRPNKDYPQRMDGAEISDLTFHGRMGGQAGALTRMGEMIENYTGGRY